MYTLNLLTLLLPAPNVRTAGKAASNLKRNNLAVTRGKTVPRRSNDANLFRS